MTYTIFLHLSVNHDLSPEDVCYDEGEYWKLVRYSLAWFITIGDQWNQLNLLSRYSKITVHRFIYLQDSARLRRNTSKIAL